MLDRGIAYIALGSNLGRREAFLELGRSSIQKLPGTTVLAATPVEETEPVGPSQGRYLNQMIAVETKLEPHALLRELQAIERDAGRERTVRWGPRTLDLDIVYVEGFRMTDADLTVPHPELANREFWKRELELLRAGQL